MSQPTGCVRLGDTGWLARKFTSAECGVVAKPDAQRGHIVKAYVVPKPGALEQAGGAAALTARLQDHVKKEIAPYKYPREIEFVDALPRTETGKLQRFKLRGTAATQAPASTAP